MSGSRAGGGVGAVSTVGGTSGVGGVTVRGGRVGGLDGQGHGDNSSDGKNTRVHFD